MEFVASSSSSSSSSATTHNLEEEETTPERSSAVCCFSCHSTDKASYAKCSRCHYATYCNAQCQHAHWSAHKGLCNFLKKSPVFFTQQSSPVLVEEYLRRRVDLFAAFPPNATEEDQWQVEMTRVRRMLHYDTLQIPTEQFRFLGLTMFMESICKNMKQVDGKKSLAFVQSPYALHWLLLFGYQLGLYLLTAKTNRKAYAYKTVLKRELLTIWRLMNQMLIHEAVALHMASLLDDTLPLEYDGQVLPAYLVEQKTTIRDIFLFFMLQVEEIGDDLEGLSWQAFSLIDIFTKKCHQHEENMKRLRNALIQNNRDNVSTVLNMLQLAQQHAIGSLQANGIFV